MEWPAERPAKGQKAGARLTKSKSKSQPHKSRGRRVKSRSTVSSDDDASIQPKKRTRKEYVQLTDSGNELSDDSNDSDDTLTPPPKRQRMNAARSEKGRHGGVRQLGGNAGLLFAAN
jgi:hypothetical protein